MRDNCFSVVFLQQQQQQQQQQQRNSGMQKHEQDSLVIYKWVRLDTESSGPVLFICVSYTSNSHSSRSEGSLGGKVPHITLPD